MLSGQQVLFREAVLTPEVHLTLHEDPGLCESKYRQGILPVQNSECSGQMLGARNVTIWSQPGSNRQPPSCNLPLSHPQAKSRKCSGFKPSAAISLNALTACEI